MILTHPYYVVAPAYSESSAGIKALYVLVDALNSKGQNAYIVNLEYTGPEQEAPNDLNAPALTWEISESHRLTGLKPIVVYPEVVDGNPLRAKAVVRYVLNLPGLLGGTKAYASDEFLYGYGKRLANEIGFPERSLFVPVINLNEWADVESSSRNEVCVYASKYRSVHNQQPFGFPPNSIEISRNLEDSLSRKDLIALLRRSDRIYLYENTALAIEAPLCGCIAVMMPNPYLAYPIGDLDHGVSGIAWGDSEQELARARATVSSMRDNYQSAINAFPHDLELFIERTQKYRNTIPGFSVDCNILTKINKNFEMARYAKKLIKIGIPGWVLAFKKLAAYAKKHGTIRTLDTLFSVASKLL